MAIDFGKALCLDIWLANQTHSTSYWLPPSLWSVALSLTPLATGLDNIQLAVLVLLAIEAFHIHWPSRHLHILPANTTGSPRVHSLMVLDILHSHGPDNRLLRGFIVGLVQTCSQNLSQHSNLRFAQRPLGWFRDAPQTKSHQASLTPKRINCFLQSWAPALDSAEQ